MLVYFIYFLSPDYENYKNKTTCRIFVHAPTISREKNRPLAAM